MLLINATKGGTLGSLATSPRPHSSPFVKGLGGPSLDPESNQDSVGAGESVSEFPQA